MQIQKEFGRRLRDLRRRSGLTQEELAERCGPSFVMQRIGEIERGEANCTLQTIDRLAKGLKRDPAELFLFHQSKAGHPVALLDERLVDVWKAADDAMKRKILRILSELL